MPKESSHYSFFRRATGLLGSSWFFWAVTALLVLQAAWIALSGRYPMAFDEDFHLGMIRLYAHHLSPFWDSQPAGGDAFGTVTRDPSYLYQYLMSFPYRLISLFTSDQTIQVLILRALNIGLFVGGLVLYRRLLTKTGASGAIVNFCLLIFVLIPIVPLLAAQINYDNLILPLAALALLLAAGFDKSLGKGKRIDVKTLVALLLVCILASLVKYAFLPVFVAILAFVVVRLTQRQRSVKDVLLNLARGWQHVPISAKTVLAVSLVLAVGLFAERYAVNLARYHVPAPACDQVLTLEQCGNYPPWIRDYNFKKLNTGSSRGPIDFSEAWLRGMWLRTFFAVDGPASNYETRGPLTVPALSAKVFLAIGGLATLLAFPRLLRRYDGALIWLFVASTISYVVVLWLTEYQAFLATGQPVAINGRYLLVIWLPVFLIMAVSTDILLKNQRLLKLVLASAAVLCLAWGGGGLTFVLRSSDSWYWPNSAARAANHAVQRAVGPVMPGYNKPTQYLP